MMLGEIRCGNFWSRRLDRLAVVNQKRANVISAHHPSVTPHHIQSLGVRRPLHECCRTEILWDKRLQQPGTGIDGNRENSLVGFSVLGLTREANIFLAIRRPDDCLLAVTVRHEDFRATRIIFGDRAAGQHPDHECRCHHRFGKYVDHRKTSQPLIATYHQHAVRP